jgi:hypothetical protein
MTERNALTKYVFAAFFVFTTVFGVAPRLVPELNSAAHAAEAPYSLFAVLRPDSSGNWYIQSDSSHRPYGIDTYIEQTSTYIRIFNCCVATMSKAGSLQVSSDDGFNVRVDAHGNLGSNNATIQIYVDDVLINPANIWTALGGYTGNGNLWIDMKMWGQ